MLSNKLILKLAIISLLVVFVGFFTVYKRAVKQPNVTEESSVTKNRKRNEEPILPIPSEIRTNATVSTLGEKLFNDPILSQDNKISCSTCHSLSFGGTDHLARSMGMNGRIGTINAPTVFNSAYNFTQFWDGRAVNLEDQLDAHIYSEFELGTNWEVIMDKLNGSPEYVSEFSAIYKDGIQINNIKNAIATFERSLVTPNSRFDRYLQGDQDILTDEEKAGYEQFKTVGCVSCHQGINVGGNLFQKFGMIGDYFNDRGKPTNYDLGRYNFTKKERDKYVFKVPSLRNVEHTFPYFHDGSAKTLEDAVEKMSKYQLGRKFSRQEIDSIVKFLKTLNGEYRGKPL